MSKNIWYPIISNSKLSCLTLRHESLLLDIIEGRMKGRPTRGRRRLQMLYMLAKDVMWQWSEKLKTDGDGVKESHVRNLLHSRTLDRERGGTHLFGMLKLTPSAPLYLSTVWCYKNAAIIRPRRSRSAAAYSRQTFPWTICLSVCLVHCGRTADRIWMPFGVIGRTGPGMRHIVGFWDQSTGRGTFGGEPL